MLTLNTKPTHEGIALFLPDETPAGMLAPYTSDFDGTHWQFMFDGRCIGPMRRSLRAAKYDALAYWEEAGASKTI